MTMIAYQMTDYELNQADCVDNPECIYMRTEDDDAECDAVESLWLAGLAVTQPKHSPDY